MLTWSTDGRTYALTDNPNALCPRRAEAAGHKKYQVKKDLGVIMDKALEFSEHINTRINKANRNLGIVFRTFTYMHKEMFLNLYKSIVRPHLEYAVMVCTPLFKKDMIAIENVQRRATKLVSSIINLTYQGRLKCLGLPSLEYKRKRADLIEVFKIMNDVTNALDIT